MSISKSIKGLFTAAALSAGLLFSSSPADASFTVGAQGGGYGGWKAYIELEDNGGQTFRIWIPYKDDPRFKDMSIDIMADYISWKDLKNMTGGEAAGFLMVIDILARDAGMTSEEFVEETGLDQQTYEDLQYKQMKYFVLRDYYSIRDAAYITDPWQANQQLQYTEEHIEKANRALEEAAQSYPNDPDFQVRPLTVEDLHNIRRNVAEVNVSYFLTLFAAIDAGQLDEQMLPYGYTSQLSQTVNMLYFEIQKDPSSARNEWDDVAGNEYNREILRFMDEELATRGIDREEFYERLVTLWSYYNRYKEIEPVPPDLPVEVSQPLPAP